MSMQLNNLRFRYAPDGTPTVDDVTLHVDAGMVVCLFGPSGCGKTTLLRLIAGLEDLDGGEIIIDGAVIANRAKATLPEHRPVGFVFQDFALFPHLTAVQNVAFGLTGALPDRLKAAGNELIAVEMDRFAHRYPHELSGGQQQRVALARVFARRPKALLLDEPFASIDTALRRRLRHELRVLLKMRNTPSVIVTHDPEEALAMGDRIVLMRDGRIIENATPAALYTAPKTAAGAGLFPGAQSIQATVSDGRLRTAYGDLALDVGDRRDGAPVTAVFRTNSVRAIAEENGPARIIDKRDLGASIITFASRDPVSGRTPPPLMVACEPSVGVGDAVRLTVSPEDSFLFDG